MQNRLLDILGVALAFSFLGSNASGTDNGGLPYKLGVEKAEPEGVAFIREAMKVPQISAMPTTNPIFHFTTAAIQIPRIFQETKWRQFRKLEPVGGEYFMEPVVLDVPHFFQHDTRWAAEPLGPTQSSLGREGCAVACAAMLLNFYGAETDPKRLNQYLIAHERGYTGRGWLWWEDASDLTGRAIVHAYESDPNYRLIDANLRIGNPVIVRVTFPNGVTHFVIIVGKDGYEYLTLDPGVGGRKGIYPLKELGLPIDGLRFYVRTGAPVEQPTDWELTPTDVATTEPAEMIEATGENIPIAQPVSVPAE